MHSTFLRESAFIELQDEFRRAAKRGVQIDIFWGASKDDRSRVANLDAAIAINHRIGADHHLRGRARVHLYSTGSHAKLLLADRGEGPEGPHVAVVGSCNWLYSGFNRVEASAVVHHPHAVGRIAQEIADLIFGAATSSQVAADLTTMARTLKKQAALSGDASIYLVAGDAHGNLMRQARTKAERSIVIGGDRFGIAAEARTIVPMVTAAARSVDAVICFSQASGPVSGRDQRDLTTQATAAGVRLVQIPDRELHGKFLLWDDDHVVITSLNWSSADTRADAPQAEIGLYLNSPGLAADVRRRLLEDWPALGPPAEAASSAGSSSPARRRTLKLP
jgi:phosphatidylserine/phosphatidylglycerophosphate/cardiolipin synthase-like enzyme